MTTTYDEASAIGFGAAPEAPTVIQALAAVKAEVQPVPKDRSTEQRQGEQRGPVYRFRGIEAVLGAVQKVMAKHGVVTIPRDLDLEREVWSGYGPKAAESWSLYRLKIEWTIYGPGGDSIVTVNYGEALDNGDKGLGKARSYAQKDLLIRILELPTDDPGHGDTEDTQHPPRDARPSDDLPSQATEETMALLIERLGRIVADADGRHPREWAEARYPSVRTLQTMVEAGQTVDLDYSDEMLRALDAIDARLRDAGVDAPVTVEEHDRHAPCENCGSSRTNRVWHEGRWICADPKGCADRVHRREVEEATGPDPECVRCGQPIPASDVTYGDDDQPYHAEHNPLLSTVEEADDE